MTGEHTQYDGRIDRRTYIAAATAAATAGLAGCFGDDSEDSGDPLQIGSGQNVEDLGGTLIQDLPDLQGNLHIYSGRNKFLVGTLLEAIEGEYDEFSTDIRYNDANTLVSQINEEGSGTPADVFFSVNAGSLAKLASDGRARPLSETVLEMVDPQFRTDSWVGTSGRARTVPHNTNQYTTSELPSDVMEYENFGGDLGWAPGYSSCQAFLTAMRQLEGEQRTSQWLEGVVDNGIRAYDNEFAVCQAIADGEIDAGFTNHYYLQRVLDRDADAPIAPAFTEGDAGSVFNVAGAAVVDEADDPDLAENFIRHLLSANVQDFFANDTFEYPLTGEVTPEGDFPPADELDVPDIRLSELDDIEPTLELMRNAGINV